MFRHPCARMRAATGQCHRSRTAQLVRRLAASARSGRAETYIPSAVEGLRRVRHA